MAKDAKKKNPSGIKAELVDPGPGMSTYLTYAIFFLIVLTYGFYTFKPDTFNTLSAKYPAMAHVKSVFQFLDSVSPFKEFIDDTNDVDQIKKKTQTKERIFTKEELKQYDGSVKGKGPYLAVLGQVFDVSKGMDFYGPGGGYSFFSGIDGSRAFITGNY